MPLRHLLKIEVDHSLPYNSKQEDHVMRYTHEKR